MHVHCSIIQNTQNVETQINVCQWMNRLKIMWSIHTTEYKYYSAFERKETLTRATTWTKHENIMLNEVQILHDSEVKILYDSTFMRTLGEKGDRVSIWEDDKNSGDRWW